MHDKMVSQGAQKNLFRGKSIKTGKMVFGSLISVPSANYFCILPQPEDMHPMDVPYLDGEIGTIDGCAVPVYSHTVGQFTGLCDKTSKRIFEGDIVRCVGFGSEHIFVVVWDVDEFDFKATNGAVNYGSNFTYLGNCEEIEVIGNIYDGPFGAGLTR